MRRFPTMMTVAVLACCTTARGAFLDFAVGNTAGHVPSLSYAGGTNPLVASDLGVTSIQGQGTPLNGGTTLPLAGRLDFTTGSFLGTDGGRGWLFGPGGNFAITDPASVYSGTMVGNVEVLSLGGGDFKVVSGGVVGTLGATPADFFGVPGGPANAGFTVLFHAAAAAGDPFTGTLDSGNVSVTQAPEPASFTIMAVGSVLAAGIFAARRGGRGKDDEEDDS